MLNTFAVEDNGSPIETYILRERRRGRKRAITQHDVKDDSNVIKIKNLQSILAPNVLLERNQKQLRYAEKCLEDLGHSDVHILARGVAIYRGYTLANDLQKSQPASSASCDFYFSDPSSAESSTKVTFESHLFEGCKDSIMERAKILMNFKEAGTDFKLKPCISLTVSKKTKS